MVSCQQATFFVFFILILEGGVVVFFNPLNKTGQYICSRDTCMSKFLISCIDKTCMQGENERFGFN